VTLRNAVTRTAVAVTAAAVVYGVIVAWPQMLFAYQIRAGSVVLHARAPIGAEALPIAAEAQRRVSRSPFYAPGDTYDVFLCDTPALFALFAPINHNVGGIADVYLTRHIFLRPSRLDRNRLIGPSGAEAAGDRTLTYFIAHEITHIMTARRLGRRGYFTLETWQREGYADYIGKGGAFDFAAVLRDFKARATDLDPAQSGLYLRYHLLVAHVLDGLGLTAEAFMSTSMPAAPIEAELERAVPMAK
jgi:hypothetical protein